MNRQQRRAQAKKEHKGSTFQAVFKSFTPEDGKPKDESNEQYCNRHDLQIENPQKLTARDKEKIKTITFVKRKGFNEKGEPYWYKTCPRCFRVIHISVKTQITDRREVGLDHNLANANL